MIRKHATLLFCAKRGCVGERREKENRNLIKKGLFMINKKFSMRWMVAIVSMFFVCLSVSAGDNIAEVKEKEKIHKEATGEDSVGNISFRRMMTALAVSSQLPITNTRVAATPLVSNVVGKQNRDQSVIITYDLNSSYQCSVSCDIAVNDSFLPTPLSFKDGSHVGIVSGGANRSITWLATDDWPNQKSNKVKARITVVETDVPQTWAHITIEWAKWGGSDIDICGYWIDKPSIKVGFSHGSGSSSSSWRSMWKGDNTGSGPEYVLVGVAPGEILNGVSSRKYKIHFNHYGTAASSPHVKVTVSSNGSTLSKISDAATRRGSAANTSDPFVVITFDGSGTPMSITTN